MGEYTPKPWAIKKCICGHPACSSYHLVDKNGHTLGVDSRFEKEDAQFIVKAANHHDELLESCKEIIECEDQFYTEQNNTQLPKQLAPWAGVLHVIFKVAKQAVAKAEKGEG